MISARDLYACIVIYIVPYYARQEYLYARAYVMSRNNCLRAIIIGVSVSTDTHHDTVKYAPNQFVCNVIFRSLVNGHLTPRLPVATA
jgi:hypothetical protein